MPIYCCHFLDDHDLIAAEEDFEANATRDAIEQARAMLRGRPHHHRIEVWEGGRRLYPTEALVPPISSASLAARPQR